MPYLALTAGPIYATLQKARKPKEIWAASYLFSWLMRELLLRMRSAGFNILSPHYRDLKEEEKFGAGLTPDRIFCQGDKAQLDALQKLVADTIQEFSMKVAERINVPSKEVEAYFQHYFRIHSLAWEDPNTPKGQIFERLNQFLSVLDLQPSDICTETSYIQQLFGKINNSFLVRDAYGREHPILKDNGRFPSLPEFAAAGLKQIDAERFSKINPSLFYDRNEDSREEDTILQILKKEFPDEFRMYHKYIALVKADGDNFGKVMEAIGDRPLPDKPNESFGLLRFFDACLFDFGVQAAEIIHQFGGNPVYIGGDDLLFFAPVAVKDNNIFNLCHQLDGLFRSKVVDKMAEKQANITPTLSFGIHVCYAKFPLYEALKDLDEQLELAKNEAFHPQKNAIAFSLRKHSGTVIRTSFIKTTGASWDVFRLLINVQTSGETVEYFNSIAHKLDLIGKLIDDPITDADRLQAFFQNQFNEDIHQKNKGFTDLLQEYILHLKSEYSGAKPILPQLKRARRLSAANEKLYATLRFIQFLNSKDDKNDRLLN